MNRRSFTAGLNAFALPPEHAATAVLRRLRALLGYDLLDGRTGRCLLQLSRFAIEPLQRGQFVVAAKLGLVHRRFEYANGLVIDLDRHRERMRSEEHTSELQSQ